MVLPWLVLGLRPLLSVNWVFLDPERGQCELCVQTTGVLLCTLSAWLNSHVLIRARTGSLTLCVHLAFRAEVAKAGWNVVRLP